MLRSLLIRCGCWLAGMLVVLSPAAGAERPNILFIFSDDHATQAIGAYGGRLAALDPTPQIDRLASQGMLFRSAFCTNAICAPSRAVILTGQHSHLNGLRRNGDRFDPSKQTFPKLLQEAGYRTALIGKWHLASTPQGFDDWCILPGQGKYYNPEFITPAGRERVTGYCTDLITDRAVAWLREQRDTDQPFLLMCQHKAPHRNWMPALRHLDLYADRQVPVPETLFDTWTDNAFTARIQEMEVARDLNLIYDLFILPDEGFDPDAGRALDRAGVRNRAEMTAAQRSAWDAAFGPRNAAFRQAELSGADEVRWRYQRYLRNYLRCIRALDEGVGRLLDELAASGLADNTIVVYASDQGFFLGEHGWYDKRWMYEESLRLPLIVRWPGVTAPGSTNDALVQNLDFASTFLAAAGITPPAQMQGRSLVPLLRGATPDDWRDAIYYHYFEFPAVHMVARHYGIRTERYKLMHFYQFEEWEFYDLQKDPDERRNAYADPDYAKTIAELKRRLAALRQHYRDDTDIHPEPAEWQAPFRARDPQAARPGDATATPPRGG
jgi:arylsulfatase A-like enzyme